MLSATTKFLSRYTWKLLLNMMFQTLVVYLSAVMVLSSAASGKNEASTTDEGERLSTAAATNTLGNPYYNTQYDYYNTNNPYTNKAGYYDPANPYSYNSRYYNARSYPGNYGSYSTGINNNSAYAGYRNYPGTYNPSVVGNPYYTNNLNYRGYPNAYNQEYNPNYNGGKYYDPRYHSALDYKYNQYNYDPKYGYNTDINRYNQYGYDPKYQSSVDYTRYNRQYNYDSTGAYNYPYTNNGYYAKNQ